MTANTVPIYSKAGQIGLGGVLTTANTAKDGTGTVLTIFTADATNGGRVERVRAKALGTNVATVLRIFINNGGSTSTASNNVYYADVTLSASTLTETASITQIELPNSTDITAFPLVLPPGYKLTATIGTTVAAGWAITVVGGTY